MTVENWPTIRKAKLVVGKTLTFRDANVDDAAFILSLRTDEKKSRFLSAVSADLSAQQAWLTSYASSKGQAYFIIEYQNEPIGTVRLYDAQQDSFCWGSWILKDGRPVQAAMESALMVYSYAIDHLGFKDAHFTVHKANQRVCEFHERFGAQCIKEDEIEYSYSVPSAAISNSRIKYKKFLIDSVMVPENFSN